MHPLTLWLTSIAELGERERDRAMERRQRESRGDELTPLARDGRWAAAMHRWAERSGVAEAAAPAATAQAPLAPISAAPISTVPTARLGCA
ncbi:hypothetical protein [Leifsonia poae]|uniref:Uncharacterized protein n=1 Tax=Leifsonia poae TaxID=110933 RepID=A0A9W6HCU6_9MICO|nr:hypothetical protein [Leifsonia poae]GLJ77423.1 hypothetical protein GCM10017584_29970 [Leifsonia poae]